MNPRLFRAHFSGLFLIASLLLVVMSNLIVFTSAEATWQIISVDTGNYAYFTLDSNDIPHIIYDNNGLKHAIWNGTGWNIQTVDSINAASFVLDSNNNLHAVYLEYFRADYGSYYNGVLKYASWNGATWNIQNASSSNGPPGGFSLVFDSSDHPHIGYISGTYAGPSNWMYVYWNGSTWISRSPNQVADSISVALDSKDNPHVARGGSPIGSNPLLYYSWNVTSSSWDKQRLEEYNDTITSNVWSLALDSNENPHICYTIYPRKPGYPVELKYANWNGTNWNIKTIDSVDSANSIVSLALDSHNKPHVIYGNNGLKYAEYNGTAWNKQVIDAAGSNGSIAIDSNDNMHVCYNSNGVKYANFSQNPIISEIPSSIILSLLMITTSLITVIYLKNRRIEKI